MRFLPLVFGALLASCGPDGPPQDCHGGPDFEVTISAEYGPLPADTVLRLHYGGRAFDDPEELVVAAPSTPRALFCYVSDKNGVHSPADEPLGVAEAGGAAGAGGAASEPGKPIEALFCRLWTDGSADLDVVTQMYGTTSVKLQTKKRVCTVEKSVELTLDDAGVKTGSN
jgi:hypothetical protein